MPHQSHQRLDQHNHHHSANSATTSGSPTAGAPAPPEGPKSHTYPRTLLVSRKNTTINRVCYLIERVIANLKTWRVLHTDYRRPYNTFETTIQAVTGLIFAYTL